MKNLSVSAAALALAIIAGTASAQTPTPDVAFNAAVTSDYVFRGFSQTNEDPALSLGVDATVGKMYLGAWASNVDFGDDTDAEVDLYGGYRTELGGFVFDVGGVVYLYVNEPSGADYNYVEAKVAISRAVGPVSLGGVVYFSPDFFGPADKEATYLEANAAFTPADKWTVSGAIGHQDLDASEDYTTWNLGVAYALTENLVLDGRYFDTDVDGSPLASDRIVGTVKVLF